MEDRGQGAWSGRAWKQDADRVKKCAEEAEEGGRRGVKQGEEVGKIRAKSEYTFIFENASFLLQQK